MKRYEYHIHPHHGGGWLTLKEDSRIAVRASTLEEAVKRTLELAARWRASVFLHTRTGDVKPLKQGPWEADD